MDNLEFHSHCILPFLERGCVPLLVIHRIDLVVLRGTVGTFVDEIVAVQHYIRCTNAVAVASSADIDMQPPVHYLDAAEVSRSVAVNTFVLNSAAQGRVAKDRSVLLLKGFRSVAAEYIAASADMYAEANRRFREQMHLVDHIPAV